MIVQCYDFIKAQGGDSAQGYGIIFNDLQQCNITMYAYAQANAEYLVNKAYVLNPASKNIIIVNGFNISTFETSNINLQNDSGNANIYFGGKSTTGGNQYNLFRTSAGLLRIDSFYNNQYKSNPLSLNWDNTNTRVDLRLLSGTTDRLGFFGSFGFPRQSVSAVATDAASTMALANSLRQALYRYGLIGD